MYSTNKLPSTDALHFGQRRGFGSHHRYFFHDPPDSTPSLIIIMYRVDLSSLRGQKLYYLAVV
jgi:hypothetical protein